MNELDLEVYQYAKTKKNYWLVNPAY
jgi:hypothetical protein